MLFKNFLVLANSGKHVVYDILYSCLISKKELKGSLNTRHYFIEQEQIQKHDYIVSIFYPFNVL